MLTRNDILRLFHKLYGGPRTGMKGWPLYSLN